MHFSDPAFAQNPGDMINLFGVMVRAAIVDHARIEWSKIPPNQTSCIDEALQRQGYSIDGMIENGVAPTDPRISSIRFGCRTSTASVSPSNANPVDIQDLSSKPTFDCTRARTLTARTVCLDQIGAAADWDLISAYWARYFSAAPSDRPAFDDAQQRWLDFLNQTCPRAQDPRQCILSAYHKRAASYRSQLSGDALVESRLTPEQRAKIQQSLLTLGFLNDNPDGEFGTNTRAAIRQFKDQSGQLQGDFLTAQERTELLQGGSSSNKAQNDASNSPSCRVADPTGTPLNVRTQPNGGDVVDTLSNGTQVRLGRSQTDTRGHGWSEIERVGSNRTLGWVFRDYIDCASVVAKQAEPEPEQPRQAETQPEQPRQAETQPEQPRRPIETARLKEARAFLDDSKNFIGEQKSVPSISAIANEAAGLQIALDKFDEPAAVQSMQKLANLLKPIPGFDDFEQQQQATRAREKARFLAEAKSQADKNTFFIDGYMKNHLGDTKTASLLKLRGQIDTSLKTNIIEEISKANDAVAAYVTQTGLMEAYDAIGNEYSRPVAPAPDSSKTLAERFGFGDKSKIIVEGPQADIVILYNASSTAPHVWKNVRGDIVFQNDEALLCFARPSEVTVQRYIEHVLSDRGAKNVTTSVPPTCDLSKVATAVDIIAFQRGELLKERDDYILTLGKLIEAGTFRQYEIITDYPAVFQSRQTLSLQIETEVESNVRKGFGVIAMAAADAPVACVITSVAVERGDGLKELLRRNTDVIAPTVTGDWQTVDTANPDVAFLGLQRRQCGYVIGEASTLRSIMLALRRDGLKYAFSPVWWSDKDLDQATFDANDKTRQKIVKDEALKQQEKAQHDLEMQRQKDNEKNKTEIERKLREKYGVRARGLENAIHEVVIKVAENRPVKGGDFFPGYIESMDRRLADHWETFDVNSEVADFGLVQWQHRSLDAIVVRSVIHQKNRILGKYEDRCYFFGMVDDGEFGVQRDPIAVDCGDTRSVNNWKIGKSFQSQWNAN
ncbi:MAG: hypothetical protein P4L87_21365 [Formivibrio sp.]|nr:hypothetical protein [Formivibrio sp.]